MKVLIYSHVFAPGVGGVETVVMSLAAAGTRDAAGALGRPQVTVATPAPRGAFDDTALPFHVVRQPGLRRLVSLIEEADVLHLAGPALLPMFLGFVFRKPSVVEHHGVQTVCPNGQLLYASTQQPCPGHFVAGRHAECFRCNSQLGRFGSRKLWALTFPRRWLSAHAQFNVMPTQWLGDLLKLPQSKVIYHGMPEKYVAESVHASPAPVSFAFVGRLVTTKGAHTLVEAAKQIASEGLDFRLTIIGDGPEFPALQRAAADLGLGGHVHFLGLLTDLEEHLREVDAVVMPSLAGEVFGLVAAENMLRGKLLIVSNTGALKEVVGDTGLSFAPGDSRALADCLRRVITEPGLAKLLGERARRRALELFREERMVDEHFDTYGQLLTGTVRGSEARQAASRPHP